MNTVLPSVFSFRPSDLSITCLYNVKNTGHSRGENWEYFTLSSHCLPAYLPQDDGTFELVLIVS